MMNKQVVKNHRGIRVVGRKVEILELFQDLEDIYGSDTKFRDVLASLTWQPFPMEQVGSFCN